MSCGLVESAASALSIEFIPTWSLYFLLYFALAMISSRFSFCEKAGKFLRFLAMSGRILKFNSNSSCNMSFTNLSCLASPRFSWLRRRLRCDITISGLSSMKILDQRCLIRGSEKNVKRTQLLFSLKVWANRTLSTYCVKSGTDLRIVHGKSSVSIFTTL